MEVKPNARANLSGMTLASHFNGEIQFQFATSASLLLCGLALLAVTWAKRRRMGTLGVAAAVLVALPLLGVGGFRFSEVDAMQHNHLCHAHNSDGCPGGGYAHDSDGHTHSSTRAAEKATEDQKPGP